MVDGHFSELTTGRTPGVAVLVSRDGKTLFDKGYGYASLSATSGSPRRRSSASARSPSSSPPRPSSACRSRESSASTTHLAKFIPDYPRGSEVTLRHLLTHTSGIHNYTDKPDFLPTVTVPIKSVDEFIGSFENDPYDFPPGSQWSYSNSGYFLLGAIVAKVSGQPYGDFLRAQLFEPLGMKDTGVYRNGDALAHDATGYSEESGTLQKAVDWDMSRAGGAGALYSTVEDLARWNEAVFAGRVLTRRRSRRPGHP